MPLYCLLFNGLLKKMGGWGHPNGREASIKGKLVSKNKYGGIQIKKLKPFMHQQELAHGITNPMHATAPILRNS